VVDITEISAVVAAAGVLVGVAYYILDMRNQASQRQTDMVIRQCAMYGSTEFQKAYQIIMGLEFKDYEDYRKRYSSNAEVKAALSTVGIFFESLGVLFKRKLISLDLVDDLFSLTILSTWELMKPIVEGRRKEHSTKARASRSLNWFEYLYNEMEKRVQQPASKTA